MRVRQLVAVGCLALATTLMVGCGGNSSGNDNAPVYLSVNIPQGPADVDISVPVDVVIQSLTINSHAKSTATVLSQQQDVRITKWVITPSRTDGGTVASPQWTNYYEAYVPAGGSASLTNYRIFPAEFFTQAPLNQLFPANGGFDQQTGKRNIRQQLQIQAFGTTVAGRNVAVTFSVTLNFYYVTQ